MIWIVLLIFIVLVVIGAITEDNCYEWGVGLAIIGVLGILVTIMAAGVLILSYPYTIDSKIEMYEKENIKIEEKVKNTVIVYMDYEKDTYKDLVEESDLTTLLVAYPELNSNELVKSEIQLYISNNNKIKELKEKQIDRRIYRFWLYFG